MTLEEHHEKMRIKYGYGLWESLCRLSAKTINERTYDKFDGIYIFDNGPTHLIGLEGYALDVSDPRGADHPIRKFLVSFREVPGRYCAYEYAQADGKNAPGLKTGDFYPWQREFDFE